MRRSAIGSGMSVLLVAAGEGLCAAAQTLELVRDGQPTAAIVAAPDLAGPAAALRDGLRQTLGVEFTVVAPDEVMAGKDWRLNDDWLDRPLILVGNVANNRAMFVLFSQFLEGANGVYPGPGRYSLRVLFQPFRRGVHMLSVGASDPAGLDAGGARLVKLAGEQRGVFPPLVEIGDATGPTSQPSAFSGDFITAVSLWYWQGDRGAGQRAREVLVAEAAKPDLWGFREGGHYDWERHYRPLRQLLASGLLSDSERQQVEAHLVDIALRSTDWAGLSALRAAPGAMTNLMSRHPISGLIGHFIIYEYLANVAELPPEQQAEVAKGYALLRDHIRSLIDGDGRREILTFTLAEWFAAHDLGGERRFAVDIRGTIHDEDSSGLCSGRPACVAAWRPNAQKHLEYLFFPHYTCYRVTAMPELGVSRIEHPGGNRGGKFAFAVPDVTGDGREELAVVGLYGFGFGVIPSETPLEQGQLPSYLGLAALTGYSSGNQEFRLYHDGAVVRDRDGAWLGIVALNPGGIDFFAPTDFRKLWSHFSHPPNLCSLLADLDDDGKPEILVGREDGYVVAYEIGQGRLVAKAAPDGPVRSLALLGGPPESGARIVAGTGGGLTLWTPRSDLWLTGTVPWSPWAS
ncbi:MAG: hypothetical protein FJX75_14465 [Armatimonadetes bacterium]|nr:hypothetical protein [Armatimonadota bacterium]